MKDLPSVIDSILPALVELRHEIHAHPELGYGERETAARVLRRLEPLPGLAVRANVAETGIVATLGADRKGPCIALRAELDALPIAEETDQAYASTVPGRMHACGHDGHTAAAFGARAEVRLIPLYPGMVNDPVAAEFAARTAAVVVGDDAVARDEPPSLGGEDFAFFARKVPAAFCLLGLRPPGAADYPDLHQPGFDFNDRVLPIAVRMHCELALRFASRWRSDA